MKALSLTQPWAWVVVHGPKRVENRTWPAPRNMIGQRFAIHAAKSWDEEAYVAIRDAHFGDVPVGLPFREKYTKGAIIGLATLDRCVGEDPRHRRQLGLPMVTPDLPADQVRWFFGPYGYVLSNVVPIRTPVEAKGSLGFWAMPPLLEATVMDELRLAQMRLVP